MLEAVLGALVGSLSVIVLEVMRHRVGDRQRREGLGRLLREEVRHLLEYIDARLAVARLMVAHADKGQILPGSGPPPPSVIYRTFLPEIAADLPTDHRFRLNILYGSADSMHAHLTGAEDRFVKLASFRAHGAANDIVKAGISGIVDHMLVIKTVGEQFLADSKEPFRLIGPKPKTPAP